MNLIDKKYFKEFVEEYMFTQIFYLLTQLNEQKFNRVHQTKESPNSVMMTRRK